MKVKFLVMSFFVFCFGFVFTACASEKEESYKVQFFVDNEIIFSVDTKGSEKIEMPNDPIKAGYIFDDWYFDNETWTDKVSVDSFIERELTNDINVYAYFVIDNGIDDLQVQINDFEKENDTYSKKVSNDITSINMKSLISVNPYASWSLTSDLLGDNVLNVENIILNEGLNSFYLNVKNERTESAKQYIIEIYRNKLFTINFYNEQNIYITEIIEEKEIISEPTEPIKTGYTFKDWGYDFTTPITSDLNLYADWELINYDIIYNLDNGINNATNPNSYTIESETITLSNPTKTGYIFNGWFDNESFAENSIVEILSGTNGNLNLYAKFTPINYQISFNGNGATNVTMTNQCLTYDISQNLNSNQFEKFGYNFMGWSDEESSNIVVYQNNESLNNLTTINNEIITLYAIWEEKEIEISFNNQNESQDFSKSATYNQQMPIITQTPTKTGYVFKGYFDSIENGKKYYNHDLTSNVLCDKVTNTILYAHWEIVDNTITYHLNGGINDLNNPNGFNVEDDAITLNNPSKTGYTFKGWYNNAEFNGNKIETIETGTNANVVLYAKWEINSYSITFVTNGGINDLNNPNGFNIEDDTITLNNPNKTGYSFIGWYNNAEFNGNKIETIETGTNENVVLYARWEINSYSITFVTNGGDPIENMVCEYNSSLTIPVPQRDNYTFENWYVDELGQELFNYETMPANNLTLYAKWKVYKVEISYNENKLAVKPTDTLNAELFSATAIDTDNMEYQVTATIIAGTQEAGNLITIKLQSTGKYNKSVQKILTDIQVLDSPTISYNTEKDYINSSDTLNGRLFNVSGLDSFGSATQTTITAIPNDYVGGDLISLVLSSIDKAGNINSVQLDNIKVYGNPIITYDAEKLEIKETDTINLELFNISAVDSFEQILTPTISYTRNKVAGNTINVTINAIDSKGNTEEINFSIKVYGLPSIDINGYSENNTIKIKETENLTLGKLGANLTDSFGNNIDNYSLTLINGVKSAGQILTYKLVVTDVLGNSRTLTLYNILVYGTPNLTYNQNIVIKSTNTLTADLLNPVAYDSFGKELSVSLEIISGEQIGGTNMQLKLSAIDELGNEIMINTGNIAVYDENDINITYSALSSNYINIKSKGEEFFAQATDSFNDSAEITIECVNGIFEIGNIVDVKLVATDKAGNVKKSETISNLIVFDEPIINYQREELYIYENENIYSMFNGLDCLGESLVPNITILSGTQQIGEILSVQVEVTDNANNTLTKTYQIQVVENDNYYIILDSGNNAELSQNYAILEQNQLSFTLPTPNKEHYDFIGWFDSENKQYTNELGENIVNWDKTIKTTLFAKYSPINYTITYHLNGGTNDSNNPVEYSIESEFSLFNPIRDNYIFNGWFDNEEFIGNEIQQIELDKNGNLNLYAQWLVSEINDFRFSLFEGNYELTDYVGSAKNVVIPSLYKGKQVIRIGFFAFHDCYSLTSVVIPDSVTSIGELAFYDCDSLTSIVIPNSVTSIGSSAFEDCDRLTSVVIPDSVTSIGDVAFAYCDSLTSVVIGSSVTRIGNYAFAYCDSLTSIVIPNSVTSIGDVAFEDCDRLTSVVIPDSVTSIGDVAFAYCDSLTSVVIGSSVTRIGNYAFAYCDSLTSIVIPNSVTSIGDDAFEDCDSLYEVYNLSSLNITKGSSSYGYVGYYAEYIYTSSDTPSTLVNDNGYIYSDQGDDKILIKYIGNQTKVVIPDYITKIYEYAFYNNYKLTSVVIPDSVTSIGNSAFYDCDRLTSVVIPDSVTSIGGFAFAYCDSLTIYAEATSMPSGWGNISVYLYSKTQPGNTGNYWRYVDGVPTKW